MPTYAYKCCGDKIQAMKDRNTCPSCGKKNNRDELAELKSYGSQAHGRIHSVEGVRNYFDRGLGVYINTPKERIDIMKERGLTLAPGASSWESPPDIPKAEVVKKKSTYQVAKELARKNRDVGHSIYEAEKVVGRLGTE